VKGKCTPGKLKKNINIGKRLQGMRQGKGGQTIMETKKMRKYAPKNDCPLAYYFGVHGGKG